MSWNSWNVFRENICKRLPQFVGLFGRTENVSIVVYDALFSKAWWRRHGPMTARGHIRRTARGVAPILRGLFAAHTSSDHHFAQRATKTKKNKIYIVQFKTARSNYATRTLTTKALVRPRNEIFSSHVCLSGWNCGRFMISSLGRMWMNTRLTQGAILCVCGERKWTFSTTTVTLIL